VVSITEIKELQKEIESKLNELKIQTNRIQNEAEKALGQISKRGYKIDKEKIPVFFERFWHTYPTKNPNEWEVVIPIFIPFNIGWFDRTDGGYNIFTINKYTKWLGEEIPTFISHEMNLPPSFKLQMDGSDLEFEEGKEEEIENRFGKHLTLIEKNKAKIKQGHEFDLLAEIIDAGFLPFKTKQVNKEDLMESDFIQIWDELEEKYNPLNLFDGKYSYQGNAWQMFEKYGSLGIFWAMSFGKTVIGTYIFSRIKGKKCLVVPTTTLKEHWEQFLKWNCPRLLNEIEIFTYQGMSRKSWNEISKKEYAVVGFDECHFLPADSFSKLASINTKYRFGLSGTPYREDGRTNYIMALTGYPIGLDWRTIMQVLGKEYHTVNVHVVKDLHSKFELVKQLYNPERRTIVFVNLLDIGEKLADMLNIPFISGSSKKRMDIIKESKSFVASRVLELGVSIKDLEHIIEVDFLFGSRREEVQRTGRLMHSLAKGKVHDIVMTKEELENYGKRLYGLYEKGFRYKLIPHLSGISVSPENKVKIKPSKKGGISYTKVINELFKEGFFQSERTFGEISKSLERRGVATSSIKAHIFSKLNGMVKTGKLFKIESSDGYKFKQRN
jgi:DNA excision repair protein ERCC-3